MKVGILNKLILIVMSVLLLCSNSGTALGAVVMPWGGGSSSPSTAPSVEKQAQAQPRQSVARAAAAGAKPPTPKRQVRVAPAPSRYYLYDIPHEFQTRANCGPVTTNMVLGYYGIDLTQKYTANKLRPSPDDVSVNMIEMATFAEIEYGFAGYLGRGGNMRMVEQLIANQVPVIVLQAPS